MQKNRLKKKLLIPSHTLIASSAMLLKMVHVKGPCNTATKGMFTFENVFNVLKWHYLAECKLLFGKWDFD